MAAPARRGCVAHLAIRSTTFALIDFADLERQVRRGDRPLVYRPARLRPRRTILVLPDGRKVSLHVR